MVSRLSLVDRIAVPLVLVALLVLANAVGNLSPYFYLIALLVVWPLLLGAGDGDAMMHPIGVGYLVAFLCLAVGLVGSAQHWGDLANLWNFLPFILFFPAYGLFNRNATRRGALIVASLALAGAAVSLLSAFYDVWGIGLHRARGFINLSNPFAMASVMLGFLSLMGMLSGRGLWRVVFLAGPVMGTWAAILAGTRSALIVAVGLTLIFAVFMGARLSRKGRLVWSVAMIALMLAGIFVLVVFADHMRALSGFSVIYEFLSDGTVRDHSTQVRVQLYIGGMRAFLDSPIFGFGWYDNVEAARQYMTPDVALEVEGWSHLHNDYLNFATLAGVFGIVAYGLYLGLPVVGAIKSVRDSQFAARFFGALTITGSYGIHGLFNTAFAAELLLCFGPVATAVLLGYCKDAPTRRKAS